MIPCVIKCAAVCAQICYHVWSSVLVCVIKFATVCDQVCYCVWSSVLLCIGLCVYCVGLCINKNGKSGLQSCRKGAIHLWCPHGGGGGQAQVDACGRGEGAPCGRPHRKLNWRHTVFFSCKEVGVSFTKILSLDRKKVEIFLRYKLLKV